jgi:hypothetical protein
VGETESAIPTLALQLQLHRRHIECSLIAEFLPILTRDQSNLTQTHEPAELHQRLMVAERLEAIRI